MMGLPERAGVKVPPSTCGLRSQLRQPATTSPLPPFKPFAPFNLLFWLLVRVGIVRFGTTSGVPWHRKSWE